MFGRHIIKHLSEYLDGEFCAGDKHRVEVHLQQCSKCRNALEEIRFGSQLASKLSLSNAPELVWKTGTETRSKVSSRWLPAIVLTSLVLAAGLSLFLSRRHSPAASWEVTGVAGTSQLHTGEVLQTDASSEAQVKIADIGQLVLNPNTRIRLLVSQTDQHRIALDRGKLEATTWAPPRLFIVETPSATASFTR